MHQICVLPDLVIDQIAAGEVLEHPASAVKELIENSLDAGAKEIRIAIEAGGLQRILIEDDGCGMNRANASLCLKRHATSKIRTADDLQRLVTMGFRGEALAAISSVCLLELKTSDGKEATRICADAIEPCARNRGTSIEARNLFFNTPARLKFQKSPSACAAAILKTVQTISLAHPDVAFHLESNGKPVLHYRATDWKKRAEEVLGPFQHEVQSDPVWGLVGGVEETRGNRSGQTLFVNGRPIQSHLIAKAVKDGFGTRIPDAQFPVFLLFIEIPPDTVDVNVHPQKREVRFREEGRLYNLVRAAISSIFSKEEPLIAPAPWDFTPAPATNFILHDAPIAPAKPASLPIQSRVRPLALLGDFLLLEADPWKLVDLRGAEARILFEQMDKRNPPIQPLMWPHELDLGPGESAEEMAEVLREVGIDARALGKRKLAIDALPVGMETSHIEPFVAQFFANKTERRLAASLTRVCRASSRKFSFEEAQMIWNKLERCSDSQYDPLGKKIAVQIQEELLAELFA